MPRIVLVLVDPNNGRRHRFADLFQRHFEVYSFSSPELAISAAVTMDAGVLVAHVDQESMPGAELCQTLREELDGRACLMVLHGRATAVESGGARLQISVKHGADLCLADDVEPRTLLRATARRIRGLDLVEELEAVTFSTASRDANRTNPGRPRRAPTQAEVQAFFRRLDGHMNWPALRELLVQPLTPVIDELPDSDDLRWRDALLARPSWSNIRKILEKPVTPLVRRLPSHRPPTINEILLAEVNARNIRLLLSMGRPAPRIRLAL